MIKLVIEHLLHYLLNLLHGNIIFPCQAWLTLMVDSLLGLFLFENFMEIGLLIAISCEAVSFTWIFVILARAFHSPWVTKALAHFSNFHCQNLHLWSLNASLDGEHWYHYCVKLLVLYSKRSCDRECCVCLL